MSSENENSLIVEKKNRILYLTLNRPDKGNSLNPPLIVELLNQLKKAQDDKSVKSILITGAGEKDFCTGIDVYSVKDFSREAKINLANVAGDIATLIYMGKPTVIAINGRAMGMGIVFSCAADYRFIVEKNLIQMPEVNFGAFPGASCIVLMSRVCGISWTKRILMTGKPFTSEDAINANISDEIVERDPGILRKAAKKMAKELGKKNPINLKSIKFATNAALNLSYMEGIELESKLADWYAWGDPDKKYDELWKIYNINYELTGDPEQLMKDFNGIDSEL